MRTGLVVCGLVGLITALASIVPTTTSASRPSVARPAPAQGAADRTSRAGAPCTKRALEAAIRRAHAHARIATKHAFGCARGFAYAFAITGTGAHGFEENLLFRASGRRWNLVSRAKYCKKPIVPTRVKKAVCFSS